MKRPTARPIEELLSDLSKAVPHEEWDKLPKDLNDNLDYYLYGSPIRPDGPVCH